MKLKGVLLALIASTIIPLGSPSISQAANPSCTPSSTRVTTDGYLVESFTATNNSTTTTCDWSVPLGVSAVDVLVVGGGGGGGYDSGGGGGGGGVIYQTNKSVSGVITIVIGAGGKGGTTTAAPPLAVDTGIASSFSNITAPGGAAGPNYTGGTGPFPGAGSVLPPYGAGGIGGYYSNSSSWSNAQSGDTGFPTLIIGSLAYFGGGGGGGGWNGYSPNGGAASLGGGGKGANSVELGGVGVTNTGGGGGASAKSSVSAGDGGSGIVIVRFSAASGDFTAGKNISATFRVASNLTVTVAQPAKVTFLANGKAIPGCKSLRTTGSSFTHTVTCAYKPSVHGVVPISALVNPVGSTGTPLTLNGGSATSVARATKR